MVLTDNYADLQAGHTAAHNATNTQVNLNTAAITALQGTSILTGTGSPEGVVTAGPGSLYRDVSAANGASLWYKNSGAGNTDWRVLKGDTGRRLVRSWDTSGVVTGDPFPTGWIPRAGVAGVLTIRRIGDTVTVVGTNFATDTSVTNSNRLYVAPAGFAHSGYYQDRAATMVPWFAAPSTYKAFAFRDSLARADSFSTASGDFCPMFKVTYITEDAWPTSLPGSAV